MAAQGYHKVVTALCRGAGWPLPVAEYRFAPPRLWRFDLAWPNQRVACEIQGGLFLPSGGRHANGAALLREYEKLNRAQLLGWRVLLITPEQVVNGTLTALLAEVSLIH